MTILLYILSLLTIITFLLLVIISIASTNEYLFQLIMRNDTFYYHYWNKILQKVKKNKLIKYDINSYQIDNHYYLILDKENMICNIYFGKQLISQDHTYFSIRHKIYNILTNKNNNGNN